MSQPIVEYEHYNRIKLLGQGAFGKAFLAECVSDGSLCVIKQVDLSQMTDQEKKDTLKEAKILESFNHPNIVRFREVYKTKKGKLCIVMDYADGGDIAGRIQEQKRQLFPENQVLDWFTQICLALKHVHDRKIIHRDLKGQNIFLTKANIIKLGDFGIARVLNNTKDNAKTMIGTPYYLSPEIINGKAYSFKSDIWSLGVVLYEMCALKPPFEAQNLPFLALKIVKGQYSAIPNQFSRDLKNLVGTLLQLDAGRRPTINEILRFPLIQNRIQNFLTKSVKIQEFSHTVLHKQQVLKNNQKFEEIKSVENEGQIVQKTPKFASKEEKKDDKALKPPVPKQNFASPVRDQKAKVPASNESPQKAKPAWNQAPARANKNSPNAAPAAQNQQKGFSKDKPASAKNALNRAKSPEDKNNGIEILDLWKDCIEEAPAKIKGSASPEKPDLMIVGANKILNKPRTSQGNAPAQAKPQVQQNQMNRVASAKRNNDKAVVAGPAVSVAASARNSKEGLNKGNVASQPNLKKGSEPTNAGKTVVDKKPFQPQQKLFELREKVEKERKEKEKKEKKAMEEEEIKLQTLAENKEQQKQREVRKKEMLEDVRNQINQVFKKIDNKGGLMTPETDQRKAKFGRKEAEEEKMSNERVVKGGQEAKMEKAKEVKRVNVDLTEKIYNNILDNKSSDSYETPRVLQVQKEVLDNGITQSDNLNVEIYLGEKEFPIKFETDQEQDQDLGLHESDSNGDIETNVVPDEVRASMAASVENKSSSKPSLQAIPSTSDAAILDTDPLDSDEEREGEEEDPFIEKLEMEITHFIKHDTLDPKELEHLQDINDLITELTQLKTMNLQVSEEEGDQIAEAPLSSGDLDDDRDDDDDLSDMILSESEALQEDLQQAEEEEEEHDEATESVMDFSKLETLKMKLEEILGANAFNKAYNVTKDLLEKYNLEEIQEKYGHDGNYASLFPFLSEESLVNHLEFVFTYVICEQKVKGKGL